MMSADSWAASVVLFAVAVAMVGATFDSPRRLWWIVAAAVFAAPLVVRVWVVAFRRVA